MNSIFVNMDRNQILDYVLKLKNYGKQPYNLDAVKLSQFVKIKTELLKIGLSFNMADLDKSDDELINLIQEKVSSIIDFQNKLNDDMSKIENDIEDTDNEVISDDSNFSESDDNTVRNFTDLEQNIAKVVQENTSVIHKNINDMLNVDVNVFDEERAVLRDAIFNKTIFVKVQKAGKNFQMKWNISMTELIIRVPSNWEIDVDHTLLLDLHTKEFGKPSGIENCDLTSLSESSNIESDEIKKSIDEDDVNDDELDDIKDVNSINITSREGDIYDSEKIIEMFKEMKDYPKIRHTLKRKIGISYKEATALIKKALLGVTSEHDLVEMGIDINSRLYKQLTR